jgi:hypothetical protein
MLDALSKLVNKTTLTIETIDMKMETLPYRESLQSLIKNPSTKLLSITTYHSKLDIKNISRINSEILSESLSITKIESGLKIDNSKQFDTLQDMIDWIAFCVFVGAISIIDFDMNMSKKEFTALMSKRLQKFI